MSGEPPRGLGSTQPGGVAVEGGQHRRRRQGVPRLPGTLSNGTWSPLGKGRRAYFVTTVSISPSRLAMAIDTSSPMRRKARSTVPVPTARLLTRSHSRSNPRTSKMSRRSTATTSSSTHGWNGPWRTFGCSSRGPPRNSPARWPFRVPSSGSAAAAAHSRRRREGTSSGGGVSTVEARRGDPRGTRPRWSGPRRAARCLP